MAANLQDQERDDEELEEQWDDDDIEDLDLDETLDQELDLGEDAGSAGDADDDGASATGYESNVVELAGRSFTIEEPNVDVILRILKVFGQIMLRGEAAALRRIGGVVKNPKASFRSVAMGALAALSEQDLVALGGAVLQFEDDKEGRKWLRSIELRLSPLVRAFFLNLSQSEDLRETIADFFTGFEGLEDLFGNISL